MKCIKCNKPSTLNLKHIGVLCRNCFLKVIEKRVRKCLRTQNPIKKNDKILVINNESKEFAVGDYLLNSILKGLPVEITIKKSKTLNLPAKTTGKYNKIIIPWSLDDEDAEFIGFLFDKNPKTRFSKKSIKLLKNISEDEIILFAKIKRFKYKEKKKSGIKKMLDNVENKYPGYKFSLLNSIKNLDNLL